MLRRLWASLGTYLWIATTPLALTVLAAEAAETAEAAPGEHGEHHVVANPIQNFAVVWGFKGKGLPPPFSMQILNFAVFVFIVGKYAGPSMKRMVRERHDSIKHDLEESARLRAEAQRRLDEYSARLASLQKEIDGLVATIRAEAESEKKRILDDAKARADRMQRDAELQIQAEIQRVRLVLEREAVVAAVALAEKLLIEKTTDADQKALADRFLKALGT